MLVDPSEPGAGGSSAARSAVEPARSARRLRFAMVTTFYPPYNFGGDGLYVRRLVHALARRGHAVHVIHDVDAYRIGGGKADEPLPEPPGVVTHPLRSRSPRLATLATHQTGHPIVHGERIREILDQGFDVIHFHNISLVGGPGVLAYGEGIKLYTAHEHWLVCESHILWRHNREPCSGRECLRCVLRAKRPPQLWRHGSILPDKARHIDEFLALSRFSADKHREFGFPLPMRVFPSFLPDEEAQEPGAEAALPSGSRPYFLFVGRLEVIKGLEDVIPRFDETLGAELWIAGAGAHEPVLRKLAEGRPAVRFLGRQTPAALRSLYRGAVALIASSRCFEVFPLVMLEAFREGTPVVGRRLGPYPEILEQSGAGLLFDTDAELRTALERLLREPGLRAELGASGARAFERTWSERVVLDEYFGIIREVATRRGLTSVTAALGAV